MPFAMKLIPIILQLVDYFRSCKRGKITSIECNTEHHLNLLLAHTQLCVTPNLAKY